MLLSRAAVGAALRDFCLPVKMSLQNRSIWSETKFNFHHEKSRKEDDSIKTKVFLLHGLLKIAVSLFAQHSTGREEQKFDIFRVQHWKFSASTLPDKITHWAYDTTHSPKIFSRVTFEYI